MQNCVCCSPDAVESKRIGVLKMPSLHQSGARRPTLICKCCHKGQFMDCAMLFKKRIEETIPNDMHSSNKWYQQVTNIDVSAQRHHFIEHGECYFWEYITCYF